MYSIIFKLFIFKEKILIIFHSIKEKSLFSSCVKFKYFSQANSSFFTNLKFSLSKS